MSSAEVYGIAVHELGHMLGLTHNADSHSVMYFLNIDGTQFLDSKDILDLSRHHKLRAADRSVPEGRTSLSLNREPTRDAPLIVPIQ